MKILTAASVIVLLMLWLDRVQAASIDFRYKLRGTPLPPRPPPLPQYIKKWEHQRINRVSVRPRPIPVHIPPAFVPPPVGPPIRPTPAPPRTYWQNTKTSFQAFTEKLYQGIPEKTFHSSSPISRIHEFDYHVQTNSIPTHSIPIKQVDEKGPIHTIPAPNLSLADKPIVVEEMRAENKPSPQKPHPVHIQQLHQYQVTETAEPNRFREQQLYFAPDAPSNLQTQSYSNLQQQQVNHLQNTELFGKAQAGESQLTRDEVYQFINSHLYRQQQRQHQQQHQQPQQQQQQLEKYSGYEVPILSQVSDHQRQQQPQEQYRQQLPVVDYQTKLSHNQLFHPEAYTNQLQQTSVSQHSKQNGQTPLQGFAYERQVQTSFSREDPTPAFISADYNLRTDTTDTAASIQQEPDKPDSNLPFVEEVFDLNEENVAESNKVEPNGKPSDQDVKSAEEKDVASAFYTTLPNRQAAETLASLQAAGKINSNLMQITQQQVQNLKVNNRTPLEIYIAESQPYSNYELRSPSGHKEKYTDPEDKEEENVSDLELQSYGDNSFASKTQDEQNPTIKNSASSYQIRNQDPFGTRIKPNLNP